MYVITQCLLDNKGHRLALLRLRHPCPQRGLPVLFRSLLTLATTPPAVLLASRAFPRCSVAASLPYAWLIHAWPVVWPLPTSNWLLLALPEKEGPGPGELRQRPRPALPVQAPMPELS